MEPVAGHRLRSCYPGLHDDWVLHYVRPAQSAPARPVHEMSGSINMQLVTDLHSRKPVGVGYEMSDATWTGMQEAAGLSALPGFLAGTPVAVLAGFNLATAILVVSQRPNPDKWMIWASASSTCLFLGAAAFLVTMALSGRAQFLAL